MNRRKLLVAVCLGALAAALPSIAQQQGKIWRIGFLAPRSRPTASDPDVYSAFPQGMRELGYVEGKNFVVEWRFADGKFERLPGLAAELVRMKVDVIVAAGTVATEVAQRATTTIPIVIAASVDPVGSGFVKSLARPGGNITGMSNVAEELSGKRLELLKEIDPKISRMAVFRNPTIPIHAVLWKETQAAATALRIKLIPLDFRGPDDFEILFGTMAKEHAEALIVLPEPITLAQRKQIVDLAARNRLPGMYPFADFVDAGGLIAYGPSGADLWRRAASYVDKILKGRKPADLPVEQPTKFELVINRKTANALGLTIPQSLLISADRVIE